MKKLAILSIIAFVLTFAFMLSNTTQAWAEWEENKNEPKICDYCYNFRGYNERCANCNKVSSSNNYNAKICDDCYKIRGNYKDRCIKCHKLGSSNSHPAKICDDCYKKGYFDKCIKCGKWGVSLKNTTPTVPTGVSNSTEINTEEEECLFPWPYEGQLCYECSKKESKCMKCHKKLHPQGLEIKRRAQICKSCAKANRCMDCGKELKKNSMLVFVPYICQDCMKSTFETQKVTCIQCGKTTYRK